MGIKGDFWDKASWGEENKEEILAPSPYKTYSLHKRNGEIYTNNITLTTVTALVNGIYKRKEIVKKNNWVYLILSQ